MESTSPSERTAQPRQSELQAALGETQVLDRQVAEAKEAVLRTLDDVKANLGTAADVRLWTQRYPWLAVGVAAATGFAAASLVTPSRGQSLQDKIDELTLANKDNKEQSVPAETDRAANAAAAKASTRSAIATTIFGSLFEILRMAMTNFAMSAMRPPVATSESHNGHGDPYAGAAGQTPPDGADGESA